MRIRWRGLELPSRVACDRATLTDTFGTFTAEVGSATCSIFPGQVAPTAISADPGLLIAANQWQANPVVGSAILTVGEFPRPPLNPEFRVDYQLNPAPPLADGPMSYDIQVRIRELLGDTVKDSMDVFSTYWIKTFPLKKTCTFRSQPINRGGYPR